MGNFYSDVLRQHPRFRTTDPVGDVSLLEPETRRRVEALIAEAAAEGVTLVAFETYRSKERQQLLFEQKVTKLPSVGVHHYGLACDIVRLVGGQPSWKGDFAILGRLARKHGLVWGGDWGRPGVTPSFVDPVHVQRCTVGRQKALFAESWYPDDTYNPWQELQAVARSLRPRSLRKSEGTDAPKRKGKKGGTSKRSGDARPAATTRAAAKRSASNRAAAAKRRAGAAAKRAGTAPPRSEEKETRGKGSSAKRISKRNRPRGSSGR